MPPYPPGRRPAGAANVDLKAFTEDFYYKLCKGSLSSVLDTLVYLKRETKVWVEITTLLIPGHNDSNEEIANGSRWIRENLGVDVPLHFTAFHADFRSVRVVAASSRPSNPKLWLFG